MSGGPAPRRRRWRRRVVGVVLLGPVVLLLLIQLALLTPWVETAAGDWLGRRTGLDTEVGGLGWSPWGGAVVRDLEVSQPADLAGFGHPLLRVKRIRVKPDYPDWLGGGKTLRAIEVEGAEMHLAVEMLAQLAASGPGPDAAPAVVTQAPAVAIAPPGNKSETADSNDRSDQAEAPGATALPAVAKASGLQLDLSKISVNLWSAGRMVLLGAVRGVELKRDESGGGGGRIESIRLGDRTIETNVQVELKGSPGATRLKIQNKPEKSTRLAIECQLAYQSSLPFHVLFQAQVNDRLRWDAGEKLSIDRCSVAVEAAGHLRFPLSWQSVMHVSGEGLNYRSGDREVDFDWAVAGASLAGGGVQVSDARLIGADFSLLGNGRISGSGGMGVLRVVVGEGGGIDRRLETLGDAARFEVLPPGNRRFLDLSVWSGAEGWMIGFPEERVGVPVGALWEVD